MKRVVLVAVLAISAIACQSAPAPAPAAAPPPSTAVRDSLKSGYEVVKTNILKSADQMPEAKFAFQPTKDVRTFGQILGDVANENYTFCGAASGATGPGGDFEKTTKKEDVQKALADSFAFCDRAFDALDDQTGAGAAEITQFDFKSTKLGMLSFNTVHDAEHYGNLVTYLRLNNMVPPSSQPRAQ